ncbi:serine/threonine-protein phosphatase 1 regulatory subunit 10-like isoform X2 [Neocloeon triangulifer]|uniref:serine/threonine-protein phosphatase 1 regulatory subunit 10-like isoform X2 n=1 Tax=Neocloeon triangulifer TaxID=2078957 RepID=UPI00286F2EC5|nr:serine/threonine-protein phosphatase 1 regulatory subunit 10-like isoform X2 [Neocloeon triangulifer]XP_059471221.1 serine/threonine-protein phosphatase 1 regulatory subunit 10-like isoform X2 [Neocloeon triangulifer]
MPRIDPHSLLECLSVLLNFKGGIKSRADVVRIVSLMSKFSKKLVSKCVYVEILHATEQDLLVIFMNDGGWELVSQWIIDAVDSNNGPLLETLLSLTKRSQLTLNLLEINDCPRSVKSLTNMAPNERVKTLAAEIVSQWIEVAKQGLKPDDLKKIEATCNNARLKAAEAIVQPIEVTLDEDPHQVLSKEEVELEVSKEEEEEEGAEMEEDEEIDGHISPADDAPISKPLGELPVYKLTFRDGKHVLAKVSAGSASIPDAKPSEVKVLPNASPVPEGPKGAARRKQQLKPNDLVLSDFTDADKKKPAAVNEKMTAKKLREEEERRKDRLFKEKQKKLKEKLAEREALKAKEAQEQKERDEATLAKLMGPQKVSLRKIPKKSKSEDGDKKKSDEKKKDEDSSRRSSLDDDRRKSESRRSSSGSSSREKKDSKSPNTSKSSSPLQLVKHKVKTFNSKFRSTGLEEESPLPPPRGHSKKDLKDQSSSSSSVSNKKRPSPPPSGTEQAPPEKKNKLDEVVKRVNEKPKSKPGIQLLQESNFFMDALNAGAKTEPRKRKRRISSSKDDTPPAKSSSSETVKEKKSDKSSPSPTSVRPVFKFYTDTLESNSKEAVDIKEMDNNVDDNKDSSSSRTPTPPVEGIVEEPTESNEATADPTKGVLVIHRSLERVKKTVRFKSDDELVSIQYFELDETERVNVTKMGGDMTKSDAAFERESMFNAKKMVSEPEVIETNIPWRLIEVDCPPPLTEIGKDSIEKHLQKEREKTVLQAIYFSPESIPDSPAEPNFENHETTDPKTIPLDDLTGNPDSVKDYSHLPWVESKQFAPSVPVVIPTSATGGGWRTGDGQVIGMAVPEQAPFQPQQGFNTGYETGNQMGANFGYQTPNFNVQTDFSNMNGMMGGMMPPNMMPTGGAPPNFMPFPPGANFGPPGGNWAPPGPMGFRGRGHARGGRGFFPARGGPRTNVCKHFARGYCRNGSTCNFKHQ